MCMPTSREVKIRLHPYMYAKLPGNQMQMRKSQVLLKLKDLNLWFIWKVFESSLPCYFMRMSMPTSPVTRYKPTKRKRIMTTKAKTPGTSHCSCPVHCFSCFQAVQSSPQNSALFTRNIALLMKKSYHTKCYKLFFEQCVMIFRE